MKKILFIAAVAAALVACKKDEPVPSGQTVDFAKAVYFEALGTNTVPNVEGENKDQAFTLDSVRAEAVIVSDSTLDIYLYQINFTSKMPVSIDMTIPGASYTRTAERITITGADIDILMGTRASGYSITALEGYLTADSLVIRNDYTSIRGTYPDCTYAGKITQIKETL